MRTRFAVTWLAAAGILVIGAGVVGASTGYRRAAAREDQLARMRVELEQRGALITTLTEDLKELHLRLGASRLQAQMAVGEVERVRRRLQAASDALIRVDERATAQQRDLEALRTCLRGTFFALRSMADDDRFAALQHMAAVDGACRTAYRLLTVQNRTN